MSLLVLQNDEGGWLATDRLVFSAAEVRRLDDVTCAAEELANLRAARIARIECAEREGFDQGRVDGLLEGRALAARKAADSLAEWHGLRHEEIDAHRAECAAVAIEIVRRIAGDVAPADWLHALAMRAAGELVEHSPLTLKVHESRVLAVRERLNDKPDPLLFDVSSDETLSVDGCVLETRVGSVNIDLDTQLERVLELASGNAADG